MSRFITLPSLASARRDVPAGIVVFLVALPLCLGIALASGAPLPAGLISGVVAGLLVSLLSGSELSVSGPAAGLTVIVAGGIAQLGSFEALTVAVVLSGLFQLVFGALRAGVIGDYIPHSVIKGMLAAIGVVIILKQIPHALGQDRDFLGDEMFLQPDQMNTLTELWAAFSAPSPGAILISAVGLAVLILWERPVVRRRIGRLGVLPGPLLSVVAGTALNEAFGAWHPAWQLTAAKDHLVELPVPESFAVFLAMFRMPELSVLGRLDVWVIAITIALVGSIETLLCIEATDKLDAEKRISDTNRELVAQGVGNVVCGLLGGLPMTSVIVRSSANVYAGGRSRLSSFVHGVALLIAATMLAPLLNRVPLAALASILFVVGYKLASRRIIGEMWAKGWTQFLPFAVTLVAIVATDPAQRDRRRPAVQRLLRHPVELALGDHAGEPEPELADAVQQGHVVRAQGRAQAALAGHSRPVLADRGRDEVVLRGRGHLRDHEGIRDGGVVPRHSARVPQLLRQAASSRGRVNRMEAYERLLLNNEAWVKDKIALRPDFFTRTSEGQEPAFLWIGCSDSRVPAEEITGVEPGELFVHRNIANQVIHTDFNMLSVVQYAVEVLRVKHIIVCGHYGCGGVRTALSRQHLGLINKWLRHIKDVYRLNMTELESIPDPERRTERLVELNVFEQVNHLAQLSFVQLAWKRQRQPTLHGWIYDIHTGYLKQIARIDPGQLPHPIYVYDFDDE